MANYVNNNRITGNLVSLLPSCPTPDNTLESMCGFDAIECVFIFEYQLFASLTINPHTRYTLLEDKLVDTHKGTATTLPDGAEIAHTRIVKLPVRRSISPKN